MKRNFPKPAQMNFETVIQTDVPHGRNGPYKLIVSRILSDHDRLKAGAALKIPLDELGDTEAKIRSALKSRHAQIPSQRRHRHRRWVPLYVECPGEFGKPPK